MESSALACLATYYHKTWLFDEPWYDTILDWAGTKPRFIRVTSKGGLG